MAQVESNPWRIKFMLIAFVYLTIIYSAYGVLGDIDNESYFQDPLTNVTDLDDYQGAGISSVNETNIDASQESGDDFIGMVLGMGNFLTFGNIGNIYARLIFTTINVILGVVFAYIIYTFIRDWMPSLLFN